MNKIGKIAVVVGTRPGIIMMAPIIRELKLRNIPHLVVHTGQHFSPEMDSQLFEDLKLGTADHLIENNCGATTHAEQTARMLIGCESIFLKEKPSLVLVNGDANTNLAAALAARKLGIAVAHSEAGERSYDWSMPEEHNRRIIDHISDVLFSTGKDGQQTLENESCRGKIIITGNTIVDASIFAASVSGVSESVLGRYGLSPQKYVMVTSHREENVDNRDKLETILLSTEKANDITGLRVIFPVHPRTKKMINQFGFQELIKNLKGVEFIEPLRYLEFTELLVNCRMVVTDSGGVQQEAYVHRRPCVTLRENTEWLETLQNGGNRLCGALDISRISDGLFDAYSNEIRDWPEIFGDGRASKRIVDALIEYVDP